MQEDAKKMTLYELTGQYLLISDALEESGGELTPEIEEALNAFEEAQADKVERILCLRAEILGKAAMAKAEEERLRGRRKAREDAAENLLRYIHREMRKTDRMKIETGLWTVTRAKSATPKVRMVYDDEFIPNEFARIIPEERRFDPKAALQWLKDSGKLPDDVGTFEVEGLVIERTEYLRVK